MKLAYRLWFLAVPVFAVTLSSCGNSRTFEMSDGKTTVTTDGQGNGKVTINGTKGTTVVNMTTGADAKYPRDFPFAQYPGSTVTMSLDQSAQSGQASKSVTLETGDTPEKAKSFYKSWFGSNQWKVNLDTSTPGMSSISARKDNATASIMLMPSAGKTTVQIIFSSSN